MRLRFVKLGPIAPLWLQARGCRIHMDSEAAQASPQLYLDDRWARGWQDPNVTL